MKLINNMENSTTNIFTYGSLIYPEVMKGVAGKLYSSCKAELEGFVRKQVKGKWYPGIIPQAGSKVEGILYLAVEQK